MGDGIRGWGLHRHDATMAARWLLYTRVLGSIMALSLMTSVGCDQLPWESDDEAVSAGAGTTTPGRSSAPPATNPISVAPHKVVAVANGQPLSIADMDLAVQELKRFVEAYQQEWQPLSTEALPDAMDLHDVLDNLVDSELKAQEARKRGLDRQQEVKERFAYVQRGFFAQEWDRWQQEQASPTEAEIHRFYEQNQAAFTDPERIHARLLVTETLAEAESIRTRAISGEAFSQLAQEFSVGPGKEAGGDAGWFLRTPDRDRLQLIGMAPTESVFFPQLEPIAFALEVEQVSQPVKGPDGRFYVVQLIERKAARQQPELEVRDGIEQLLVLQAIQEQVEKLRADATVTRSTERLEAVVQ